MANSYNYQKVGDEDSHEDRHTDGDGTTAWSRQAAIRDFSERAWFNRPSVRMMGVAFLFID